LLAAGCADSGQTGSPVSKDPGKDFQTPGRQEPERPGGGIDSGGGEIAPPNALPRPLPAPGSTALLGSTLVVAERGGLTLLDVSTAAEPKVVGRLSLDGEASLLSATALDRLVVAVQLAPHASDTEIPEALVPSRRAQVWEVDATDPAAPVISRQSDVPEQALGIVVSADGYTALGGLSELSPAEPTLACGEAGIGEIDLFRPPPPVASLWLERFGTAAGAPLRREFEAGYWHVGTDRTHAIRIGLSPDETPRAAFDVELVDLRTLESSFQVSLNPADLGTPLSAALSADYSDGVLVLAGGSRLLGFDTTTGLALEPRAGTAPITGLRFLSATELSVDGGSGLARLDRSGPAPSLSLVPFAPGAPATGSLMPFGSGYLALDGTGGGSGPAFLRATSYVVNQDGALELVDQLQTDWYFSSDGYNGVPWRLDSEGERLGYTLPVDDSDGGRTGLIVGNAGQLSRSALALTERMSPAPLLLDDAVIGFARGVLQPLRIEEGAALLTPLPAQTLALDDVWFEVEHEGLIWARHRTDTGKSSVSVRTSPYAEPVRLALPHAVDAIVPIDATHVAVLGLSVEGMCEYWQENYPESTPDCGPNAGNGVSVVAIEAAGPRVVRSLPLSSYLEGRPPARIAQGIDWQGFLPMADGKWALWARFRQECSSAQDCEELGVPAYTSYGTSGCASGQTCDTGIREFISGSLTQSWLFVLDLTNPEAPALEPAVRSGAQFNTRGDEDYRDLSSHLLGYESPEGQVWGYPVDEPVYDAQGNSELDAHEQALHRWYVQLLDDRTGGPQFDGKVSVPGRAVLLADGSLAGGAAEHTAFTLEPRYSASGEQSVWLERVRIERGSARRDQSLLLGPNVLDARASGNFIAVLSAPDNYCVEGATYSLQVVDTESATLALSEPLLLPAADYGWGLLSRSSAAGIVQLGGGPAQGGGTLSVDLHSDPPSLLEYEY
ncbi:MAG TPA: hypothetical protein VJU61_22010, partial [Polyangiaceae bacterium]|nr:hypothetical protein [Polyangiaceae bacterium]